MECLMMHDQQQTATINELALQLLPILSIPAQPASRSGRGIAVWSDWDWTPY